nr:hypothetical protein Iba_chr14dCG15700 [Ipomoea batatas]
MEMKVGWVELILVGMTGVTIAATAALKATDEHQIMTLHYKTPPMLSSSPASPPRCLTFAI